ncbi:hypothetical protein [Devosia sp.]|uniref:hypothetical protein n=1 Tax=Devosia sp. TaxID=1871048 RepID=UPI00345B6A7B
MVVLVVGIGTAATSTVDPPHPGSFRKSLALRETASIAARHIGAYLSLYPPLTGHRLKSAASADSSYLRGKISK